MGQKVIILLEISCVFLGILDPDPDSLVKGMDLDPDPSIVKQK